MKLPPEQVGRDGIPSAAPSPKDELPCPGAARPSLWARFKHLKVWGRGREVLKPALGEAQEHTGRYQKKHRSKSQKWLLGEGRAAASCWPFGIILLSKFACYLNEI